MGREVRRVPKTWQHPKDESGIFVPLYEGRFFAARLAEWEEMAAKDGHEKAEEYFGSKPEQHEYMPDWPAEETTHLMMYETCTEGTPISPAFETPEELARWLADTGASAFGYQTASYEGWLRVCRGGWAPSAVIVCGQIKSGVEAGGPGEG